MPIAPLRPWRPVLVALLLAVLAAGARADTLKVPSDAFPTIQSAVSASDPGDVILVNKGVYQEQVTIFKPGITLLGKKAVIDAGYDGSCIRVGASDVTISGFVLVNGDFGVFGSQFADGGDPPDNLTVTKCTIRSCSIGISVSGIGPKLLKNDIRDCAFGGIEIDTGNSVEPAIVSRNTIERCFEIAMQVRAMVVVIERNTVRKSAKGIDLVLPIIIFGDGGDFESQVVDNRVETILNIALEIVNELGGEVLVEGNTLRGSGRGLTATGGSFRILDNDCSRNAESGMRLGDDELGHIADSVVRDNTCKGNGVNGMEIRGPLLCRVTPPPTRVRDNDCSGNGRDGIVVAHSHADEYLDNTCKKNGGDGIDIDFAAGGLLLDGNTCTKNEHEGIDNSGIGTTLRDNSCKGNARGVGPDIAGTGEGGTGTVVDGGGNEFKTGGFDVPSRLDIEAVFN